VSQTLDAVHRWACAIALLCAGAGCRRHEPAAPWSPPPDPPDAIEPVTDARPFVAAPDAAALDAIAPDAADAAVIRERRCITHALPPEDLSASPRESGGVSIAWSGSAWGVAWTELVDGADAVYFVAVGENGRRIAAPVRITDRGMRGRHPFVAWGGEQWMVYSSGGAARFDELWLQRVDARGAPVGRARRITSRDRHDRFPAAAPTATGGWLLAWASELEPRRQQVYTLRLGAWGQQLSPPVELIERTSRLSDVAITPHADGFVVTWTAMRPTTFAVEGARVDALGQRVSVNARVVSAPHGLAERPPRAAVASTGGALALAWEQWEHGISGVRVAQFARRLSSEHTPQSVDDRGATLHAPALATLDAQTLLLAVQRSVGELDQSVLLTVRSLSGVTLGTQVRLRGHEGVAERPLLSVGRGTVAVVTQGPRGLALHRVPLVECPAADVR
jgi:hypothetical protein